MPAKQETKQEAKPKTNKPRKDRNPDPHAAFMASPEDLPSPRKGTGSAARFLHDMPPGTVTNPAALVQAGYYDRGDVAATALRNSAKRGFLTRQGDSTVYQRTEKPLPGARANGQA